ncbi:transporter substrate-binding domain-containing protein [Photobacterium lutimaris]|nr:transporter substrate-binding domain-containing protein [Photobacterium lutimaris]TDR73196.1 signal transduction histidine kinase [Photobacterium lutimaris]
MKNGILISLLLLAGSCWADTEHNRVLRIGYPNFDWAPFSYVSQKGHISGLLPSLMHEIATQGQFKTQTLVYPTFADVLIAFENNEIDLIVGVSATFKRQKSMAFSKPLLTIPMAAITRTSKISSLKQLGGKLIALEQGFAIREQLAQLSTDPLSMVSFPTSEQAFTAVQHSTTDAYLGNAITLDAMQNHYSTEGNLSFELISDSPYERLYIATQKSQERLISQINQALGQINQHEMAVIYDTWLSKKQQDFLSDQSYLNLNEQENQWLEQRGTIKVAYHPEDFPYQFTDESGMMAGMGADVLRLMAKQLNLSLVPIANSNFTDIMAQLNNGTIDAVAAVTCTPERVHTLNCTQPYSEEKWVMVTTIDNKQDYIGSKQQIGVVVHRFGEVLTKQVYADNPIKIYPSNEALLNATINRQVDHAVISLSSASHLLQSSYLGQLRVLASELDTKGRPVGVAVAKDNPLLRNIFNKALAAIPPSQVIDIKKKWHTVNLTSGVAINRIVFWALAILAIVTVLTAIFVYWAKKLSAEVRQRKAAEQKLSYLTNNFDGILLQHLQRSQDPSDIEVLFVSDKIADFVGLPTAALHANPSLIIELLRQRNDNGWLFKEIRSAVKRGYWQTELQLQSSKSNKRWIEIRSQIIAVENGWQWNSILIDISAMKQQQLELERARQQAETATETKSRFLAMMSHEIRTPISGILSLLELMQPHIQHRPEVTSIHKHLNQSARNLLNIVNDVLDFSKMEAGKLSLSPTPCLIHEQLNVLVQPHVVHAQQKGLRFSLWQDPKLAHELMLDELRLKQVLNNLLNNATKFTEQGMISLLVEVVEQDEYNQQLRFTVKDTGIGISPQDNAKLFQPFEQADVSTERRFSGTGLGLSICRQIINLMGGEIQVSSTEGIGTEFSFMLEAAILTPAPMSPLMLRCGLVGKALDDDIALPHYLAYWQCNTVSLSPQSAAGMLEQIRHHQLDVLLMSRDSYNMIRQSTAADLPIPVIVLADEAILSPEPLANGWVISCAPLLPNTLHHLLAPQPSPWYQGDEPHEPAQEERQAISREQAIARRQLLLVAEDHPINQQIIRQQLQQLGYYADIVENGKLALEALAQHPYALLLTDCHMPELDGYGLVKAIQQQHLLTPAGNNLPVVALTANTTMNEAEYLAIHGFDAYLSKPVSLATLGETLSHWLPAAEPAGLDDEVHEAACWDLGVFDQACSDDDDTLLDWDLAPPDAETAPKDNPQDTASAASGPIDLQVLGQLFGEASVCLDFMRQYLDACLVDYRDLTDAFAQGDNNAVRLISHRMKGAARMMEYHALAEHCQTVESLAANQQIDTANLAPIDTLIMDLKRQVQQF